MTKKILVAMDGSDISRRALKKAAECAAHDNAELLVLHVIQPHILSECEMDYAQKNCSEHFYEVVGGSLLPKSPVNEAGGVDSFQEYSQAQQTFFKVFSQDVLQHAEKTAHGLGVKTVRTITETGEPVRAILDIGKREKVEMIVLGRHGHNPIAEFFLGSTAKNVIRYADRTVLAVE